MKFQIKPLVIAGLSLLSCAAQASLTEIGPGLVYDDVKNITWLRDANYAKTSNFDSDGRLTWAAANNWANHLTFGGLDSGWRLPELTDNVAYVGANSSNSELADHFYRNLGGQAEADLAVVHSDNYGLFNNLQASVYWLKDELAVAPGFSLGWGFVTGSGVLSGYQGLYNENSEFNAWAVHAGNVSLLAGNTLPSSIPVPAAIWLFGSGLLGVLGLASKRRSL